MTVLATLNWFKGMEEEYMELGMKSDRHDKEEVGGKKVELDLINYI